MRYQRKTQRPSIGLVPLFLISGLLIGCGNDIQDSNGSAEPSAPNILLIVADDLGYTDLGAFGGEMSTPNLDALARSGTRLTNFHTAPSCAPTRAMLLTGMDNHQAGMGSQSGLETPLQAESRAYQNRLRRDVPTIAEQLSALGYRTLTSTKWHVGSDPQSLPRARGFQRSFALMEGGGGHFDDTPLLKKYGQAHWFEDDQPFTLPKDFYSTDFMTDKILEYLEETPSNQPFFAYLGYTTPHWPLQAPRQDIENQAGRYDSGWDDLRQRRMSGARREGVVPEAAEGVAFEAGVRSWKMLGAEAKQIESRKMEVYAAMVERLDSNIGRVIRRLQETGDLNNTLIVFISDNGAEAHTMELYPQNVEWVADTFDNSLASIGSADSYVSLGPSWARATAVPFRASKSKVSEGGIRVPAFVLLPGRLEGDSSVGGIDNSYMRVMDLAPSLIELAGGQPPAEMEGRSLWSRWNGGAPPYSDTDIIAFETYGRRGVQRGNWKAILQNPPYGTGDWQLYDLDTDLGEQRDLSAAHPRIRSELIEAWQVYADRVGVIPPEKPIGY